MSDIVDIITKLGVDASGVYSELDKVNSKYQESTDNIRKQKDEIAQLQKFEQGLQAERAKTNNPSIVAQFNNEIAKTQEKIKSLTKSVQDNTKALGDNGKEAAKTGDKLGGGIDTAVKKTLSLRGQLKELKQQLASTDDDEEFLRLSAQAGKLEDKLGDASTAARIFASDSKFEILGSALGNVGQKLLALDFDGAVQGSQLLLKASQQITFKDAIGGVKQIFTVLKNVGQALLTNPLFLIGATIAILVKVFDDLSESINAGTKSLEANEEQVKKTRDAVDELIRANRDLDLQNEIAAGKISKVNGAKLQNQNKFKDEYLKILRDQREQEDKFNADIQKEREDDGFRRTKQLFEFLGGETELTSRQKIGLREIEEAHGDQIKQLRIKFGLENDKILIEQANEEKKKREDLANQLIELNRAQNKKLRDLEVATIQDDKFNNDRKKAETQAKFNDDYDEAVRSAKKISKLNAENGVSDKANRERLAAIIVELNRKLQQDLEKIDADATKARKEQLDKGVKDQEAANAELLADFLKTEDERKARLRDQLTETQRHETALLTIRTDGQKDQQTILLANEIAYERARLQQIAEFDGVESDEFKKQTNKLEELEAQYSKAILKMSKERRKQIIEDTKVVFDAAIDAAEKIVAAEIKKTDQLIALQQKRVDEVAKIAENGNAELLELEKDRLEKLNKEKEKFVRQQQALATIELVANTAVTVSKAAAEGGAGAAVTIAAALIALIGGLAAARSIAGQAAFYDGGLFDGQGYTGDGNPKEASTRVGRKPYVYHKEEFIHNHQTTKKYKRIFQDVHEGKIDLNQMKFEAEMFRMMRSAGISTSNDIHYRDLPKIGSDMSELRGELREVKEAIKGQSRLKVNIDRDGIAVIATEYIKDRKRINTIAR